MLSLLPPVDGWVSSGRISYRQKIAAADLGEGLGTSEGHALAAEGLAIYAHYVAEEEEKEPLLQRAMRAAEAAIELDPANAQAHLQSAHATGRYSQLLAPMKSLREGYPKQVRASIERALELDPSHFGAHLSLASWHAEAIGRGGMMARALLGAKKRARLPTTSRPWRLSPTGTWYSSNTHRACRCLRARSAGRRRGICACARSNCRPRTRSSASFINGPSSGWRLSTARRHPDRRGFLSKRDRLPKIKDADERAGAAAGGDAVGVGNASELVPRAAQGCHKSRLYTRGI